MEPLSLWVLKRVEGFPRNHKFTVGDRLIESCLQAQTSLVEGSQPGPSRAVRLNGASSVLGERPRPPVRRATAVPRPSGSAQVAGGGIFSQQAQPPRRKSRNSRAERPSSYGS